MKAGAKALRHEGTKQSWPGLRVLANGLRAGAPAFLLVLCLSCVDTNPSAQERQEALLRDPFGYKTDDKQDISGGQIHQLDRDALRKDLGNVLNP